MSTYERKHVRLDVELFVSQVEEELGGRREKEKEEREQMLWRRNHPIDKRKKRLDSIND